MRWEGTDNFGNLMVAESDSTSPNDLRADLVSLVTEVFGRHSSGVSFAVDQEYQEIAAPDAGQVSHIMRVPWLTEGDTGQFEAVCALLHEVLAEIGLDATVHGPWPA
jgi:hypothetical protein